MAKKMTNVSTSFDVDKKEARLLLAFHLGQAAALFEAAGNADGIREVVRERVDFTWTRASLAFIDTLEMTYDEMDD